MTTQTSPTPVHPASEAAQRATPQWVAPDNLEQLLRDINEHLATMTRYMQTEALTHAERLRLMGSGVRRYGFIDKTSDIAEDNLQFAPPFFDLQALKDLLRVIEVLRNISVTLNQMLRINGDVLLTVSDDAFQMALAYYNTVREASRRRQPGAQAVFAVLREFFQRRRREAAEPTIPEVEHDVHALLHGRKDGRIIIEHEKPHTEGGKHVVVDETGKRTVKEQVKIDN